MNLDEAITIHQDFELLFDQSLVEKAIVAMASTVADSFKDDFSLVFFVINGVLYLTG